jgi:hypothetical protein
MKPVDFRNETFASIQNRIGGSRACVYAAWAKHGPCTTEDLARLSSISILSLRPRTTELFQLGFICLAEDQGGKGEGTYRVRSQPELASWLAQQQREAAGTQREFPLT